MFIFDGHFRYLYIDGGKQFLNATAGFDLPEYSYHTMTFGDSLYNEGFGFIDEIKIYKKILTKGEIVCLYD